jgi:hypothetical protein
MSKLIPRETIDTLRLHANVLMDSLGIAATLYIPTNASLTAAEGLDVFELTSDHTYLSYTVMCFIEWNPSKYRLKKLGIYTEGELPILVWMPLVATALEGSLIGQEVDIDVVQKSYFKITPEFIPNSTEKAQEFEVVDLIIKGTHDAIILKGAKCVPRRIQMP